MQLDQAPDAEQLVNAGVGVVEVGDQRDVPVVVGEARADEAFVRNPLLEVIISSYRW